MSNKAGGTPMFERLRSDRNMNGRFQSVAVTRSLFANDCYAAIAVSPLGGLSYKTTRERLPAKSGARP